MHPGATEPGPECILWSKDARQHRDMYAQLQTLDGGTDPSENLVRVERLARYERWGGTPLSRERINMKDVEMEDMGQGGNAGLTCYFP